MRGRWKKRRFQNEEATQRKIRSPYTAPWLVETGEPHVADDRKGVGRKEAGETGFTHHIREFAMHSEAIWSHWGFDTVSGTF